MQPAYSVATVTRGPLPWPASASSQVLRRRIPAARAASLMLLAAGLSIRIIAPAWAGAPAAPAGAAGGAPPNIILILTDDQNQMLGSLDFMPWVMRYVVNAGVRFEYAIVSGPLCCPARATILRGQYLHNHGIWQNQSPPGFELFRALGHEDSTIATWLEDAGYRTVLLGKYLNGYPAEGELTYIPPGWTEWYATVLGQYQFFNYTLNENGTLVAYGNRPQDYETDVFTRKTVDFIERAARDRVPFFVYFSPHGPHAPAIPAPRHANLFNDEIAPRTPAFNEADVSDKPAHIRNRPLLTQEKIDELDEHYRQQLRCLQAIDEGVAAIIDALRRTGTLNNTYLFFTSDNGYHLGQHRLPAGKFEPYEEDIRIPLLVRGPGVPAGRVLENFVSNIDFAPTFAQLAGIPAPGFVNGRSLVPLLSNVPPAEPWRRIALSELFPPDAAPNTKVGPGSNDPDADEYFAAPMHWDMVRTRDWKYTERARGGEIELYHLRVDPDELLSLHNQGYSREIVRLRTWLAALRDCQGSDCRSVDDPAPGDVTGNGCIDGVDLTRTQARFGQACYGCAEDVTGDWVVDQQDLDLIVARFGFGCLGDLNCSGTLDFADVNAFVLALRDPDEYRRTYPQCVLSNADCNADGRIDFADINAFVWFLSAN